MPRVGRCVTRFDCAALTIKSDEIPSVCRWNAFDSNVRCRHALAAFVSVDFRCIKSYSTCATIWILIWKFLPLFHIGRFDIFPAADRCHDFERQMPFFGFALQSSESKLCTRINGFPFNPLIALKWIRHKRTISLTKHTHTLSVPITGRMYRTIWCYQENEIKNRQSCWNRTNPNQWH